MKTLLVLALFALPAAVAAAPQTIYRCGPDGREYSQTPCQGGRPINAGDERGAGQRAAARQVARDDAAEAERLARERKAREAVAAGQGPAGFRSAPVPGPAASAARPKAVKARKPRQAASVAGS